MTSAELKRLIRKKAKSGRFEIHRLGNQALSDLRDMGPLGMHQNNRVCELRNRLADFFFKELSDIVLALEAGVVLDENHEKYKPSPAGDAIAVEECQICGEKRAVQKCHIMPSHLGGNRRDNLITLCPTHHFLFDHNRLSRGEFERIRLDMVDARSREYFMTVSLEHHRPLWTRDELVDKGELKPCDRCRKYPEFVQYPDPSLWKGDVELTVWMACDCFLNSKEFMGMDRDELRKKAIASWNAGERKNRWDD